MNAAFSLDNPLRLMDQWSLSAARNNDFSPHHRSRSLNGSVTLHLWLLAVQLPVRLERFFQQVPFSGAAYRYQGNNQTQRLGTNRTLLRDGKRKLAVDIGLARRTTENKLAGNGWASAARRSASPAWASITVRSRAAAMTLNPTVSRGLRMLGATADDPAQRGAAQRFRKLGLSASYFYPLAPSLLLDLGLRTNQRRQPVCRRAHFHRWAILGAWL